VPPRRNCLRHSPTPIFSLTHKKSPPERSGGLDPKNSGLNRFGQLDVEFDGARLFAFNFVEVGAAFQHSIEFVDQQTDGFVAFVGGDRGIHIRTVDTDVSFGDEPIPHILFGVARELHANAHDALLVSKQSLGFFLNELL
jgi:hypothetical protein